MNLLKRSIITCVLFSSITQNVHARGSQYYYKVTAYCTGKETADQHRVGPGTISAAPSIPFGTHIFVPRYGMGVVHDRGRLIGYHHIDVYMKSCYRALHFWEVKWLWITIYR